MLGNLTYELLTCQCFTALWGIPVSNNLSFLMSANVMLDKTSGKSLSTVYRICQLFPYSSCSSTILIQDTNLTVLFSLF